MTAFLLGLLKPSTQVRYERAYKIFLVYCNLVNFAFWAENEEKQDRFLAEYVLEQLDSDAPVQFCADLIVSLQKRAIGRRKFKASFTVLDGWKSRLPSIMAPPMPEQLCYASCVLRTAAGKHEIGFIILLAFVGLLRIGEVLGLQTSDILLPGMHDLGFTVIVLLRVTKRGVPDSDKIIFTNPRVVQFCICYYAKFATAKKGRLFTVSYATFLHWLRKVTVSLGFAAIDFTTHNLRRGGATALALAGKSIPEIKNYGRWASESSCKLYVMKGEVAVMRVREEVDTDSWNRVVSIALIGELIFEL